MGAKIDVHLAEEELPMECHSVTEMDVTLEKSRVEVVIGVGERVGSRNWPLWEGAG
jgi:hypothetical protein